MDILNNPRWRYSPEIEQFTKNCIQTYAATEVGYISRGLNGEPELLELVNPKNIEIYKKIAKAMAIAEKVQEETGVDIEDCGIDIDEDGFYVCLDCGEYIDEVLNDVTVPLVERHFVDDAGNIQKAEDVADWFNEVPCPSYYCGSCDNNFDYLSEEDMKKILLYNWKKSKGAENAENL